MTAAHDPIRFARPHRLGCACLSCARVREAAAPIHPWMTQRERRLSFAPHEPKAPRPAPDRAAPSGAQPARPRTPEDGQTVHTPEQGRRPVHTRD